MTAGVVDRNGEDVSDNVIFQWYANDEAIEGATDETLGVTVAMVGSTIKVVATAENGNTFSSEATEEVGVYEALEILSAEQVKKDKVKVTFSAPVTADDKLTVTKGATEKAIDSIIPDDDNLGATIVMKDALAAGEYVVTLTPADEDEDPSSVTFEAMTANKAERIEILGDYLVMKDTNFQEGYCFIKGYNHFDEEVTLSGLTVTAAPSTSTQYDSSTGKLTVKSNEANQYAIIKQVTVYAQAMVDSKAIVAQKTLQVSSIGYPAEVEFGEITKDATNAPDISDGITINEINSGLYYIPIVSVKDNYGNEMLAKDLNYLDLKNLLTTIPTDDDSLYFSVRHEGSVFTEKNGQVVVFLDKGNNKPGTFNFLMTSAGGQFEKEVKIIENPYIDTLNVTVPDIYEYEETDEFGFVGYDQDGNELDLYDYLTAGETADGELDFNDKQNLTNSWTKINAGNTGKWRVQKFADTKTYKVTFVPNTSVKAKGMVNFIITTASFNTETKLVTVGARGTSGTISSELKSAAKTEFDFNKNLQFLDANGKKMDRAHNEKYPMFVPKDTVVTASLAKANTDQLTDEKIAEANHDDNDNNDFRFFYVVSSADKVVNGTISESVTQNAGDASNGKVQDPGQYYVFLIAAQAPNYYTDMTKTRIIDSRSFYVSKGQVGDIPVSYTAKVSNKLYTGDQYDEPVEVKVDITYRNGVVDKDVAASGLALDGGFKVAGNKISKGTVKGDGETTVSVYLDTVYGDRNGDGVKDTTNPYTNDGAVATCKLTYADDDPVGTKIDFKRKTISDALPFYGTIWSEDETETVWDLNKGITSAITVKDGELTMTNGNVANDTYTMTVKDQYGIAMKDAKYYINGEQVPTTRTELVDATTQKVLEIKGQSKGSEVSQTWRVNVPTTATVTAVDNTVYHTIGTAYNVKNGTQLKMALDLAKADPAENLITIAESCDLTGFTGADVAKGDTLYIPAGVLVNYSQPTDNTGRTLTIKNGATFKIDGYFVDAVDNQAATGGAQANKLTVKLEGELTGTGHYDAWKLNAGSGTVANPAMVTMKGSTLAILSTTTDTFGAGTVISGNIVIVDNAQALNLSATAVRGAQIELKAGASVALPAATAVGSETTAVPTTATIVANDVKYAVDNTSAPTSDVTIADAGNGFVTAGSATGGTTITTEDGGTFTSTDGTAAAPVIVAAETNTIKSVSDLEEAATTGGTYVLGEAITLTGDITITKDLTINLNGKKITTADNKDLWVSNCTLTLTGASGSEISGSSTDNDITVMSTEAGGTGKLVVKDNVTVGKVGSYWFVQITPNKPVVSVTTPASAGAGKVSTFTADPYDATTWNATTPINWTITGKTWKTTEGSKDTGKTDEAHNMIRYRADFTSAT